MTAIEQAIEARRRDAEFMARLRRLMAEDAAILARLGR